MGDRYDSASDGDDTARQWFTDAHHGDYTAARAERRWSNATGANPLYAAIRSARWDRNRIQGMREERVDNALFLGAGAPVMAPGGGGGGHVFGPLAEEKRPDG